MLEVKWKTSIGSDWAGLESEISKIFPGAESLESFSDRRSWTIVQTSVVSLATAFQQLERCKNIIYFVGLKLLFGSGKVQFDIEDYSFSQTTLEQVFIEFAKQQEAADEDAAATNRYITDI